MWGCHTHSVKVGGRPRETLAFDDVFRCEGVEVIRLPVRSPVANTIERPRDWNQGLLTAQSGEEHEPR